MIFEDRHKIKRNLRDLMLAAFIVLMLAAFTACGGGGIDIGNITLGTLPPEDETDPVTEAPETEYEPVEDADAERISGIAIRSAEDLAKIGVDDAYPLDGDYVLVIDIDLSGFESWIPIGGSTGESGAINGDYIFSGTFDGRNHLIRGLRIEDSADSGAEFFGLFGSVGGDDENDPAIIKNVVLSNVDIEVIGNVTSGVGALAGQVNGCVDMNSISLLSGKVSFSGSNNLGCGSLIGQCRTSATDKISNNNIFIENVFSNLFVVCENSGQNNAGGIIGRIRETDLGKLNSVVYTSKASFESSQTYAIAAGDCKAKNARGLYFLVGAGTVRDGLGESLSEENLTDGNISLSSLWTTSSGFYPLISDVMESSYFTVMELISLGFSKNDSADRVKNNFTVTTKIAGIGVDWESDNESVISISGKNARVVQPEDGYADVTLTAKSGSAIKRYTVRVISTRAGYFVTKNVQAGEPIEVAGYGETQSYKWVIQNQMTGIKRTVKTTEPSFTPEETDVESLITVQAEGYDDISLYYSYLPVIYITSDIKYSTVSTGVYCDAKMEVLGDVTSDEYLYNGDIKIRVRGNSTATREKRPFKIKLDYKANLLGIDEEGPNKHWVLLANALDPTLMRNKIINDFSSAIGTEVYMASESVILVYNNVYYGVYQLCEHVRVDETRVNVFDWEDYAEEAGQSIAAQKMQAGEIGNAEETTLANGIEAAMLADWSWMETGKIEYDGVTYVFTEWGLDELPAQTGGFLLEMDFYSQNDGSLARTETAYKQPLYFNTPGPAGDGIDSFMTTALYNYAYQYVQSFEFALHSDDFFYRDSDTHYQAVLNGRWNWQYRTVTYGDKNNDGLHYSEMFDMDNLVQNFIFCEMIMNWDSMKNSFFVYKDIDGLAKIGPQWDFDWAWGNVLWNGATWRPTSWHCRETDFMHEQYYQQEQWNCLLIRDPYFIVKVWEMWKELRHNEINNLIKDGGIIDSYAEYLRPAAAGNDMRWSQSVAYGFTFDSELDRMNEFIDTRMDWLDRQFESVETLIESLDIYEPSDDINVSDVMTLSDTTKITARVTDSDIKYVMFQINGKTMVEGTVTGGRATVTVDSDIIDADGYNCVTVYACDEGHEYIIDDEHSDVGNYQQVVSNYHYFSIK